MLEPTHVEALVKAHAHGDDDRFYSIALGCAARLARGGDADAGTSLRVLIDRARSRAELPAFSGKPVACAKCDYAPLNDRVATDRHVQEGGVEFLEQHDDGRYGGRPFARWDGTSFWCAGQDPEENARYLELLKPMLADFPAVPVGYDGWWRF